MPTPLGPFQYSVRGGPGQGAAASSRSFRCRRCLLKGCERIYRPSHPQSRYCSAACRQAARRWRRRRASRTWRASERGKVRRREQCRRYRRRIPLVVLAESTATLSPLTASPSRAAREGQRPATIPEDFSARCCERPGCYEWFVVSSEWSPQRFCCGGAAELYDVSSIGKPALGSDAVPGIIPRADRRGHLPNPRRDVVSDCEEVPACLRFPHPTQRRQRAGLVFPGPPFLLSGFGASEGEAHGRMANGRSQAPAHRGTGRALSALSAGRSGRGASHGAVAAPVRAVSPGHRLLAGRTGRTAGRLQAADRGGPGWLADA